MKRDRISNITCTSSYSISWWIECGVWHEEESSPRFLFWAFEWLVILFTSVVSAREGAVWNSNAYNIYIRATLSKAVLKRAVALKTMFWLVFLREISSMIQTQALGPREADGSCSSGLGLREEFPFIFLNIVPRILVYKYFSQTVNLSLFCLCTFNSHSPGQS